MPQQNLAIALRPEQWNLVMGLLEEKHAHLQVYVRNKPKVATTVSRSTCNDIEEILMDIADQHLAGDEEE